MQTKLLYLPGALRVVFLVLSMLWFIPVSAEQSILVPIVGDNKAKPKNWLDQSNKPQGLMIDLLEAIGQRTNLRFTYTLAPWKRAYTMSEKGQGAIIGFSKTSEREKHWHYSDPMYFDELVIVTTREKVFEFDGLDSLSGRRLAIKRGASYGDDFERARKNGVFTVVETADRAGQMQMLVLDRVDAVLVSPGRIALETVLTENTWLRQHREDFVVLSPPYKSDPNYLGIPKSMNLEKVLVPFNEALKELRADGSYDAIVQRAIDQTIKELNSQ